MYRMGFGFLFLVLGISFFASGDAFRHDPKGGTWVLWLIPVLGTALFVSGWQAMRRRRAEARMRWTCQVCGVEAQTRYVEFAQLMGFVVATHIKQAHGYLCQRCIVSTFLGYTGKSLLLGWWALPTAFINPFVIVSNLIQSLFAIGMKPVPRDARAPALTDAERQRLEAVLGQVAVGPAASQPGGPTAATPELREWVDALARIAGVTSGQAALYLTTRAGSAAAVPGLALGDARSRV